MRIFIIAFLSISTLISCKSDDDSATVVVAGCGVENPLEELDWLKAEIEKRAQSQNEDMKYCYIVQTIYKGEAIFIYEDCNPLVDKAFPLLDCTGNLINNFEQDDFQNDEFLTNRIIIYKPIDFDCNI